MRILVYPHDLGIGGSQLNAIELAAAVQRLGHEVIVYGRPGPLNRRIGELELESVPSPEPHIRPTPSVVKALVLLARERNIDVMHGYEWPPALESLIASRRIPGTAAVATVMSMSVAPFIPKSMPLLVGTQEILTTEQKFGRTSAALLEPPVDLEANNPSWDAAGPDFRSSWGLDPEAFTVVLVSRLARELKLRGHPGGDRLCRTAVAKNSAFNFSSPVTARHGNSWKATPCRSTPPVVGTSSYLPGSSRIPVQPTQRPMLPSAWADRRCGRWPSRNHWSFKANKGSGNS